MTNISSGFHVCSPLPIDDRSLLSKSEMLTANENRYPNYFLVVCSDDGSLYMFNKNDPEPSETTGKFKPVEMSSSGALLFDKATWEQLSIEQKKALAGRQVIITDDTEDSKDIIADDRTTVTTTWSSTKISKEIKSAHHDRSMILIGDSYGLDTEWWTGWPTAFKTANTQWNVWTGATGGAGFSIAAEGRNFLQTLQSVYNENAIDPLEITDIVVLGGYNDMVSAQTGSIPAIVAHLSPYIEEFMTYCKETFPNAAVHVGCIAVDYNNATNNNCCEMVNQAYQQLSAKYDYKCNRNFRFILLQKSLLFFADGNPNSGFHPNTTGNTTVSDYLTQYLQNGNFVVRKGLIQNGAQIYVENGHVTIMNNTYPVTETGFLIAELLALGSIPFNTWTKVCDLGENGENILWGAGNGFPLLKKVIWRIESNQPTRHVSTVSIKIVDKAAYVKCTDNANGVTFSGSEYVEMSDPLHFDYQVMY